MTEEPYELLRSEPLYTGRIVNLRCDEIRLPSGRETTREVIEHPGSVVILPETIDGNVVFVEQYRYAVSHSLLELPAGMIDPGESPLVAAQRELREETGLVSDRFEIIATTYPAAGYSNERTTIFVATGCRETPLEPRDEGLTVHHLSPDELIRRTSARPVAFQNAATTIGVLWYVARYHSTFPSLD